MDAKDLFCRYRDDVYRLAVSYTRSPQEAEDVCQTVFLKLLEQQSLQPGKERAWLMQVTVNQCRSLLRSGWWKHTVALDETIPAPDNADSGIRQVLMGLKPKYRVVVYLHYYQQYTTGEIAKILKITPSAVRTRLDRARQQLRHLLKEDDV